MAQVREQVDDRFVYQVVTWQFAEAFDASILFQGVFCGNRSFVLSR
jgi:hypothetical protein